MSNWPREHEHLPVQCEDGCGDTVCLICGLSLGDAVTEDTQ